MREDVQITWAYTVIVLSIITGIVTLVLGGCYMCEQTNREALRYGKKVNRGNGGGVPTTFVDVAPCASNRWDNL